MCPTTIAAMLIGAQNRPTMPKISAMWARLNAG
jgi:hypothetical protein